MNPPPKVYQGWPADAIDLVEESVARTGGWDLWHRLRVIRLRPTKFSSTLPILRGLRGLPMPSAVEVVPHEDRAVMHDYPEAGARTTFNRGEVSVRARSLPGGEPAPVVRRQALRGSVFRGWTALEIAYFFGNAITKYFAMPFALPYASHLATLHRGGGVTGVRVKFPEWWPHSPAQAFFFRGGLLYRHDYVAMDIGRLAAASHFSFDYRPVDGLMLAATRKVFQRVLGWVTPLPILEAEIDDFALVLGPPAPHLQSAAALSSSRD